MTEQDRAEFEAWAKSMRLNVKRSSYDGSFWKREAKYAYLAWLAARRTQNEKVGELVEAVDELKQHVIRPDYAEGDVALRRVVTLAAQLKEQDDE